MRNELIYSLWSADTSQFVERVTEALAVIDESFPLVTFWIARHGHQIGTKTTFIVKNDDEILKHGGRITALWEKTVAHISNHIIPNELVVNSAAYSEEMDLSVRVYFDDFELKIETEPEYEERALKQNLDSILTLLRNIGACPAIGGCWLKRHSAFAGNPVYMYEPKKPFAKLYDPLRYDEVIEEVHSIRKSVSSVVDLTDFELMLREIGAQAEKISEGRLFVQLGDPERKGGVAAVKKLEKKISSLLRENI